MICYKKQNHIPKILTIFTKKIKFSLKIGVYRKAYKKEEAPRARSFYANQL